MICCARLFRCSFTVALYLLAVIDVSDAQDFPTTSAFQTPIASPGIPGGGISGVTLTPDGKTMVFNWYTGPWRIYTAQWDATEHTWSNLRHMPFPGSYNQHPSLSPDGELLFWVEAGSAPGVIWIARRQSDGNSWGQEQQVPLSRTTNSGNAHPFFDGSKLYYSQVSTMPNGDMWYEMYSVTYDPSDNEVIGTPTSVSSLNQQYPEFSTGIRVFCGGQTALLTRSTSGVYDTHIWVADWDESSLDWVNERLPDWLVTNNIYPGESSPWYCEDSRSIYFIKDYTVYQSLANQLPTANAGPDQFITTAEDAALVQLDGSASTDQDGDPLTYEWSAPDGVFLSRTDSAEPTGFFPVGVTTVTLSVSDGYGGVSTDTVAITVAKDNTPPVVTCVTDKTALWPPNHRIEQVAIVVHAFDSATAIDSLTVNVTVSSSEPDDGCGDGSFQGDVDGCDGHLLPVPVDLALDITQGIFVGTVGLRAERDGTENGRTYSIIARVTDAAGNVSMTSCAVVVPHDKRKK